MWMTARDRISLWLGLSGANGWAIFKQDLRALQNAIDWTLSWSLTSVKQAGAHHDGRWNHCRDCAFNWDLVD